MKILADDAIPHCEHFFKDLGELVRKPGRAMTAKDMLGVDALIVRSVTAVNADLLQNQSVRWVASATSGSDHLNTVFLKQCNMPYYVAKGCNAPAVVRYVLAVLANCLADNRLTQHASIAIVGIGHVGALLAQTLQSLGFICHLYDPPRADREPDFESCSLEAVMAADCICLHMSLEKKGKHATYHWLDGAVMQHLKPNTVIVNAARGSVVQTQAIPLHGQHLIWCLDVWENEPAIDPAVLQQAFIATPHIAGYSKESKWRATAMVYEAFCRQFDKPLNITHTTTAQNPICAKHQWPSACAKVLNLRASTQRLLSTPESQLAATFEASRLPYQKLSEII